MSQIKQIHLSAKGCSGRGVRVRLLGPTEVDQATIDAAKQMGPEGVVAELRVLEASEFIKRMLVAYTEPNLSAEELLTANWIQADPSLIETEYGRIFNAKDDRVLYGLYRHYHQISAEEIDQIVGKAIDVAEA